MRNLSHLDQYRQPIMGSLGDETCGNFFIPSPDGKHVYHVIASSSMDWDHISISLNSNTGTMIERCPKWSEMCYIKDLFFEEDECTVQYHPSKADYVNLHPYTLHMWRPQQGAGILPTPPTWMIG